MRKELGGIKNNESWGERENMGGLKKKKGSYDEG